ncbi:DUF1109 domain-containing protein [Rhodococcus aetherivorans]
MKDAKAQARPTARSAGVRTVAVEVCLLLATILSLSVLLGMYYGWPAVGGALDYDHQIFIAIPALLLLGVAGLVWAFRVWSSLRGTRSWSWWTAAAPVVVLGALLVVVLFPRPGFDEARPQLEAIAREILTEPDGVRSGVEVGGLDISRVEQLGGAVYFIESDDSFGTTHGWIYSPEGYLDGQRHVGSIEHLGGPWYEFERSS